MGIMKAFELDQPGGAWLGLAWLVVLVVLGFVIVYGFWLTGEFTKAGTSTDAISGYINLAIGGFLGLIGGRATAGKNNGGDGGNDGGA